jgi:uncharacterized membrane protein required for colicin V production
VPQIDTPLLLDILLGLVVLLFVPFGIRRGVAKEAMVSAGILLGATLAERFGQTWSAELAARFALEPDTALFAVSALLLFAGTFLLGYGGGAALGVVRPGTGSRLVGGVLAAFNAALLLSYLLRWIDETLRQGAALDDGIVSQALLRQTDLLLLAGAGVLLVLTVVGWIMNALRSRRLPRESDGVLAGGIPARQRPVRVSPSADAGKYEPTVDQVARSGRFGSSLDATSPLGQRPWSATDQALSGTNGHGHDALAESATQYAPGVSPPQQDETVWAAWSSPANEEPFSRSDTANKWPVPSSVGVTDDERCAVCRARVGPRDVFCPECGATL